MNVDIGSKTSKLHAKRNSMSMSLIGSLSADMHKALAIAVGTTVAKEVVMEIWKSGKMIFNILKRKANDEADDEADGLKNKYGKLMELDMMLSFSERAILFQTKDKLVTGECEAWIFGVSKSRGEVRVLETRYQRMGSDELQHKKGRSQHKKRRYQHGSSESPASLLESIAEKYSELEYHLKQESNIRKLVEKLPDRVIIMPGPMLEDEPFLLPFVKEILEHLGKEEVKRFALCGLPTTGKTTIMKRLNNIEAASKMFEIIIWVSASNDLDFGKLQRIIADRLKLNVEGITESDEIYHKIYTKLKGKRYLLLLDGVSESFDPSWIGCYGNEKDSKVVLTSRLRHVCLGMKANFVRSVKPMSTAVAWEIFQEKVGRNVNPKLVRTISELVAIACQGSPLVIDKVAIKFRERDTFGMWLEGLRILQGWPGTDIDQLVQSLST